MDYGRRLGAQILREPHGWRRHQWCQMRQHRWLCSWQILTLSVLGDFSRATFWLLKGSLETGLLDQPSLTLFVLVCPVKAISWTLRGSLEKKWEDHLLHLKTLHRSSWWKIVGMVSLAKLIFLAYAVVELMRCPLLCLQRFSDPHISSLPSFASRRMETR